MLRHLRDLTKQHVREGTVSAAFVVHTDRKGTAFALSPREDLPASFYKAHVAWIAKRSDLETLGHWHGPIAMGLGRWVEIESSSTDNSKFLLKPAPAADTEYILVVLASIQQFRWTWRILSRLDPLGSPFWQSFLSQSAEEDKWNLLAALLSYVCLNLSVCLSVRPSVGLSVCLSVCLPACLPVCLSVCLCVCLSVCQSVSLSVCLLLTSHVCFIH